jgi:hypothetical protein
MQPPPPHYSPDGRFWWDGFRWVAAQAPPIAPIRSPYLQPPSSERHMTAKQVGCPALVVVSVVGIVLWAMTGARPSPSASPTTSTVAPPTGTAEPTPTKDPYGVADHSCPGMCVNYDFMTFTVKDVRRNAPMDGVDPGAGQHWVVVDVAISNNQGATEDEETNAHDFNIVGTDGIVTTATHVYKAQYGIPISDINGCSDWNAVIAKSGGAFGPRPLCFHVGGDGNGPMTLRWQPRVLGDQIEIVIPHS